MRTLVILLFLLLVPAGSACSGAGLPAREAPSGWTSASSPPFDYRANGSVRPMLWLFVLSLAVFAAGLWRNLRAMGVVPISRSSLRDATGRVAREWRPALRRLLDQGILHRRLTRRASSGWLHFGLFWGFLGLALGSIFIMLEGRVLQSLGLKLPRSSAYEVFQAALEILGLLFLLGVSVALIRRLVLKPSYVRAARPATVVLLIFFYLGVSGFFLEGLRIALEAGDPEPWSFVGTRVAAWIGAGAQSLEPGLTIYKTIWWSHAVLAFGLLAAVPFTPLRHVLFAPLHILSAAREPAGRLRTPFRLQELMESGEFGAELGAEYVRDLGRGDRLGLLACADFGRCQESCPAWETGTPLSPRMLVENLKRATLESPASRNGNGSNLGEVVTDDEVWSCVLCGACASGCPVLVDATSYVIERRRHLAASQRLGRKRTEVLAHLVFAKNPFGLPHEDRGDLAADLRAPTLQEVPDPDFLYWIGCASGYDPRAKEIARAMVKILNETGVRYAILGQEETCCGELARRLGEEGQFQVMAGEIITALHSHGIGKVLTHCAHCFNTFRNEYPELGATFETIHHSEFLDQLVAGKKLEGKIGAAASVAMHDSCYVARLHGEVDAPRRVLDSLPAAGRVELSRSGTDAFCCGGGGGNYWFEVPRSRTMGSVRIEEARRAGAEIIATECPYCLKMLENELVASGERETLRVRDIAELTAEALGR